MKKVLFLVNHDVVIYNFRKELIERLLQERYEVVVSSPYGERIELLKKMGCRYVPVTLDRHGKNPFRELKLYADYKKLIKTERPDIVLTYTIKPNLYGALAARKYKIPCLVNITGLGIAVEHDGILKKFIIRLYQLAFRSVQTVFVQNTENMRFFAENHITADKLKLLPGSGVNLKEFTYKEYPAYEQGHDVLLFVGRIMKAKGIGEYIQAAELAKKKYPSIEFRAIGFVDDEYESIIDNADKRGVIRYYGSQLDMHPYYEACSAVVLPSYHEGMANVLLEASATGRPVLASNIPGCRESFDEGVSGFGFAPKNAESLYETVCKFIELPIEQKMEMGRRAREKMEREFDRRFIVEAYMEEIERADKEKHP